MVRMAEDSIRWAVRCRGHRRNGLPCKRWAIRGGFVCALHGGSSPQARRKARERLTEIAVYKTLDEYLGSPAYREYRDMCALADDRAVVEEFAARLG